MSKKDAWIDTVVISSKTYSSKTFKNAQCFTSHSNDAKAKLSLLINQTFN